ncbi:apolipoprotein L3-like [Odontesthes bonariensis]
MKNSISVPTDKRFSLFIVSPVVDDTLDRSGPLCVTIVEAKCGRTPEQAGLRALADGLERIHENTTIGSLAGGVIGAVGGITSIVGLILAPFTLGASLIVTGVGVGVGAVGGITAGVSNITNMVNQSSDRNAVRTVIKEFQQKMNAVVTWLQVISDSLQTISKEENPQVDDTDTNLTGKKMAKLGGRAGKGLSGITELVRLASVVNIGRVAAQASRAVHVAEVARAVLSGLFIAVDIFFIAMDAKEIHEIKKAREAEERGPTSPRSGPEIGDTVSTCDQYALLSSSLMQEFDIPETELKRNKSEAEAQSSNKKDQIRSEIMRFVLSVREAADKLQGLLDELKIAISSIPSIQHESELGRQRMALI